jgi:two-component system, chemotaxis family, chemotaxis protein CheY
MPILVVEDHDATALILQSLLKRLGFSNVDEASDGLMALAKIREKRYALVISDWNMEPMSGYGLLKKIRMDEDLAEIRFIENRVTTTESRFAACLNRLLQQNRHFSDMANLAGDVRF